mgnify:CR=1 FL=1
MNKKKIFVFVLILLICPMVIIIKGKFESKDDIYVLTEENNLQQELVEEKEVKSEESNITNKEIAVYISGAVSEPGVVTLKEGARLATAIEKVGGTTEKADLNGVNMAIKVQDEMHYIIPKIGETIDNNDYEVVDNSNVDGNKESKSSLININTATIEELDALPGVGEATANKIVNHRSENGDFKSIEEIKNVNGIGDKKFEEMKSLICVN